jgi:hypothetical protein
MVIFAMSQPEGGDVNEIVFRATRQELWDASREVFRRTAFSCRGVANSREERNHEKHHHRVADSRSHPTASKCVRGSGASRTIDDRHSENTGTKIDG